MIHQGTVSLPLVQKTTEHVYLISKEIDGEQKFMHTRKNGGIMWQGYGEVEADVYVLGATALQVAHKWNAEVVVLKREIHSEFVDTLKPEDDNDFIETNLSLSEQTEKIMKMAIDLSQDNI